MERTQSQRHLRGYRTSTWRNTGHRVLLLALTLALSAGAEVGVARWDHWLPNGPVTAATKSGDTLYLGGQFTQLFPNTRAIAAIDATGEPIAPFVNIGVSSGGFNYGTVNAVVPDGGGGWYLGGDFTGINGVARSFLARVASEGTLDLDFDPNPDFTVNSLAMANGVLYVGGGFSSIGGQTRFNLAALDPDTGQATDWDPESNGIVSTILASNDAIYVGGGFTFVGGEFRQGLAALSPATGLATAWDPAANGGVETMAHSGSTLYVGGTFTNIGGEDRNYIAGLNVTTGLATAWNPDANAQPLAIALDGGTVYVGGYFTQVGGEDRFGVAALDAGTGDATSWAPEIPGGAVFALATDGGTVYLGGQFSSVAGEFRTNLAAVDAATGIPTPWVPDPTFAGGSGGAVLSLAIADDTVLAAGDFTRVGQGVERNYLAALNLSSGVPTAWNPNANGPISAMLLDGESLYVGGGFSEVSGENRQHLAALDATTGSALAWEPQPNSSVTALALEEGILYVGGSFSEIGGQGRAFLAALNAASATATSWNPDANGSVTGLALSGNVLYAAGFFNQLGGAARINYGAVDTITGVATGFNPDPDFETNPNIASLDGTVYVGGQFSQIGGADRLGLAALNGITGSATQWNPASQLAGISALAAHGRTIFAGGGFSEIGGAERMTFAALKTSDGSARIWNPRLNNTPTYTAFLDSAVLVSGAFFSVGDVGVEQLAIIPWDNIPPNAIAITPSTTGPTNATSVTFSVEFDEPVEDFDNADDVFIVHAGTAHAGVAVSGSGSVYTVNVTGIAGDGTFTLAVDGAGGVVDLSGNELGESVTSAAVTIDNTPPNAVAITPATTGPTNAESVAFDITFSEAVTGFDSAADLVIVHNGTAADGILIVGSGAVYTATVSGIAGTGNFTLAVDTTGNVQDIAGNALASSVTSAAVTIDNTPPGAVAITPATTGPTNADSVAFDIVFSEAVLGFDSANDLEIAHSGTTHGNVLVSGSGSNYTATLQEVGGDGSFTVSVGLTSGVVDLAGNGIASSVTSAAVVIDNTPPGLAISAPSATATSGGPVTYTVTYSGADDVTLSADNIQLDATGTATASVAVTGTGNSTRTVTLTGIAGEGTLGITIADEGTAADAAGNISAASGPSSTFIVDNTAPEFFDLLVSPSEAGLGQTVQISVQSSEAIAAGLSVTVNGAPASQVSENELGFTYTVRSADPAGPAEIVISGADAAGNVGTLVDTESLLILERESHTADQNGDNQINLSELLRVIQFYNSAGYGCLEGTEDGFVPNGEDQGCAPHASDYNPQDWTITLTELLRLIQFYNSGGYFTCPEGEDGFCPGA